MKLIDYIQSNLETSYINDVIRLDNYDSYVKSLNEEDIVYMEPYCEDFIENYDICTIVSRFKNKILIISSPDIDFPPPKKPYAYDKYFHQYILPNDHKQIDYYDKIEKELIHIIEKNNLFIVVHAVSIHHPRILCVPLGIFKPFNHFHLKKNTKSILCYANFGLHIDRWFGNPRNKVYELIKNKEFILKKHIDSHIKQPTRHYLSTDIFYEDISKSKFAICPRGCGIDTYRLWDCICLGCIPIVEEYDGHKQFHDLPILFLKNIDDFGNLSEEYLNEVYEDFLKRDFNYNKLLLSNVIEQINSLKHKLNSSF